VELEQHGPTVALMQEHYEKRGVELNAARLRMACLPAGAEV
jgi:molybdopterin-biosynthesis enzyme MoeA-like protein